jgi:hypothetical protein
MTVKDLILALQKRDPDMEVRIAQPTHDYCRRVEASTIDKINIRMVYKDPFHLNPDILLDRDSERENEDEKTKCMLILE